MNENTNGLLHQLHAQRLWSLALERRKPGRHRWPAGWAPRQNAQLGGTQV